MSFGHRLLVVTCTPAAGGAAAEAAALGVAAAGRCREGAALLIDLAATRPTRGTILAADAARRLASSPSWEGTGASGCARGRLAVVAAGPEPEPAALLQASEDCGLPRVVNVGPARFQALLEELSPGSASVLLRAEGSADRPLAAAVAIEMRRRAFPNKVWARGLGAVGARRARAGLDPGGEAGRRAERSAAALLGERVDRDGSGASFAKAARSLSAQAESGQALPAILGLLAVAVLFALGLAALGGAATAKGRAQRAVDLSSLSAARSMRDDFSRLFVPAVRADGSPNPAHLSRAGYLDRARAAAREAADRNGLDPDTVRVDFPEPGSIAPLRVEVSARPRIEVAGEPARAGEGAARTKVAATAMAAPDAAQSGAPPAVASGGGYSGPLEYRLGKPMRPDVAAAFDRLSAAAGRAGHSLAINSAFRSDAEQAKLFAANPDPRWVAPPGKSLHRCATELDLGPSSAYGWLAANASRYGFVQRYSWEAWHYGFTAGPAPCSAEADRTGGGGKADGDGRTAGGSGLPGFVPPFAREPLLRSASRHGVSAALLAAQLMAESNFNPAAVSPAGAQGIAQFMPGTADAYGLDDPFDVGQAIDAQARLMSDLLGQFGKPALALAAYNAGPAPVQACGCIPSYPETQGYVARILGLLDGAGQLPAGSVTTLAVRLVQ